MRILFPSFARRAGLAGLGLAGLLLAGVVGAQETDSKASFKHGEAARKAEHGQIQQQRAAIETQRIEEERKCYQRFVVEDCLEEARRKARVLEKPLREREVQLNQQEREEKAAERLREIEAKKAQKAATPMTGEQRTPSVPKASPAPSGKQGAVKPPVDVNAVQAQRAQEAQQRAAKHNQYVQQHQQQQAQRAAQSGDKAAAARAAYDAKQKAAAEHKAKIQKTEAEHGPRAAPLPAPAQ